ncbi:MAG: HNH endonuclease [Nocardioidaceae bacterium]
MSEADVSRLIRESAMRWLDGRRADLMSQAELSEFVYAGHRLPLMDRQRGIRKPTTMRAALSIRTVYTEPGKRPPYEDAEGDDGLIRYKYRGEDPMHAENRALRRAYLDGLPLLWFVGVAPSLYHPLYPVWIVGDEPNALQFVIAVDQGQRLVNPGDDIAADTKRYVETLNKVRLHQPLFRARVLTAYQSRCTLCRLRHPELLDAAHIIADGLPHGDPIVPNGLAMCKIHHAAFDLNIIGVRPDHIVEIRAEVLHEIDGPMLKHGIQDMDGQKIMTPSSRHTRPDPERLEERYAAFQASA